MNKENSICQLFDALKKKVSTHQYPIIIILLFICTFFSGWYSIKHPNDPLSTMIAILLLICSCIVVVLYGILRLSLSHETARKMEIFGYTLLLLLLVWQPIIRDSLDSMANHDYLEMKVDAIFEYLTSHNADKDTLFQKYYYEIADGESRDHVEQELVISNYFVVGLQVLSTICIAIGRFDDISVKKAEKATNESSSENSALQKQKSF